MKILKKVAAIGEGIWIGPAAGVILLIVINWVMGQ